MGTILVTGATGNVGYEVVRALPPDIEIQAGMRDAAHPERDLPPNAIPVTFDFERPESFGPALDRVDRLFLMRPPQISDVDRYIAPAIDAARAAGVRHIVFLSIQGVEQNRFVPHHKIEVLLRESGLPWTFLRASFFMQNLNTTHRSEIAEHNEIFIPVGRARTSFIDVRDIGAVAARVLTEPGHENRAYTLTGPEALDYHQVADIFTTELGRPVRYVNPSIPAFILRQRREGRTWGMALVMTMLYTITRFGNASEVTNDTANLLGRSPISFRQYVTDYRSVWA